MTFNIINHLGNSILFPNMLYSIRFFIFLNDIYHRVLDPFGSNIHFYEKQDSKQ